MALTVIDTGNTAGTHIGFRDCGPSESGKTRIFKVYSLDDDFLLGTVTWFGRWRKYAYSPVLTYPTVYEEVCFYEIADFIKGKTMEHRAKTKAARA
jgi:hypothetical protein